MLFEVMTAPAPVVLLSVIAKASFATLEPVR
jgi:hypothetical protein